MFSQVRFLVIVVLLVGLVNGDGAGAATSDNGQLIVLEEFVGSHFSSFNHSSSIAETHKGVLVVTWYGGSSEGDDDVSIWVSTNDGSGWTPRIEVDDGSGDATWNPVLFQPSTGPLLLYYKFSGSPSSWVGAVRKSYDDGKTWSDRILLPRSGDHYLSSYGGRFVGPVKNRPIELPDGSLLCGSSTEHDGWQVHMEIARGDYTNDFELIGPLGPIEGIQPTFLVHDDSYMTIQALCRAPGSGRATPTTWSYDGGKTWTSLSTISLETSKGLHAVTINNLNRMKNRGHILAYNPSGRYPLRIAASQDGQNWNVAIGSVDPGDGAMDYPTIMQSSDKMLHLLFSWGNHSRIKHVVINPYVLLNEPEPGVPADLNEDCVVNTADLKILADDWLKRGSYVLKGTEPNASGLVVRYSFDGTQGSDVPDNLVDDTGTYTATIIPGGSSGSTIQYAEPNPIYNTDGASAQFTNSDWANNAGDTLLIPNSEGIDFSSFNEFTVELFINPSSDGAGQLRRIFSEYIYAYMYLDSGNTLNAIRKWGGGEWNENWTLLTKSGFPMDSWSHVAMTWDSDAAGDKFKLYVDGKPAGSAPGNSDLTPDSTAGFAIGGYQREDSSTAQFFSGKIDDFRIYNYALSDDEVLYTANNGQAMVLIPPDSPANLYEDDVIDFKDFANFASQWLDVCQ